MLDLNRDVLDAIKESQREIQFQGEEIMRRYKLEEEVKAGLQFAASGGYKSMILPKDGHVPLPLPHELEHCVRDSIAGPVSSLTGWAAGGEWHPLGLAAHGLDVPFPPPAYVTGAPSTILDPDLKAELDDDLGGISDEEAFQIQRLLIEEDQEEGYAV